MLLTTKILLKAYNIIYSLSKELLTKVHGNWSSLNPANQYELKSFNTGCVYCIGWVIKPDLSRLWFVHGIFFALLTDYHSEKNVTIFFSSNYTFFVFSFYLAS